MNTLAEIMGITCTADIGLMSIEYTCFDGQDGFSQSLCLTNTGVNTSKLNRLEHFIQEFEVDGKDMSGEELHVLLDNIEKIHGLYSPIALGFAAVLACGGFTFLLGGGPIEMFCAFISNLARSIPLVINGKPRIINNIAQIYPASCWMEIPNSISPILRSPA